MMKFSPKNYKAWYGGAIAAIITAFGIYILGSLSQYEAKQLISTSLPSLNMLCNTIVLASATILALLLTLLALSSGFDTKLRDSHYLQVSLIAKIDTIVFVASIIMFQMFNIPITEAENVPANWYSSIYWATLTISSLLTGGLVTVVILLYNTVDNIIQIIGLGKRDHPLVYNDEEE